MSLRLSMNSVARSTETARSVSIPRAYRSLRWATAGRVCSGEFVMTMTLEVGARSNASLDDWGLLFGLPSSALEALASRP